MDSPLSHDELKQAVAIIANALDSLNVEYAIIGGAGVALLSKYHNLHERQTLDVDLIVQDDNNHDAVSVSNDLLTQFPQNFTAVNQYGVNIPAVRLQRGENMQPLLVGVEIFDFKSWPQRPQYNLHDPANPRMGIPMGEREIPVLHPAWFLREKILSQFQRAGSLKRVSDVMDIANVVILVGEKEVILSEAHHVEALKSLLQFLPSLREQLERAIKCPEVFPE